MYLLTTPSLDQNFSKFNNSSSLFYTKKIKICKIRREYGLLLNCIQEKKCHVFLNYKKNNVLLNLRVIDSHYVFYYLKLNKITRN